MEFVRDILTVIGGATVLALDLYVLWVTIGMVTTWISYSSEDNDNSNPMLGLCTIIMVFVSFAMIFGTILGVFEIIDFIKWGV